LFYIILLFGFLNIVKGERSSPLLLWGKKTNSCKTKLTQATRLNDQLLFNDDMLSCLSQQNFEKVVVLLQDEFNLDTLRKLTSENHQSGKILQLKSYLQLPSTLSVQNFVQERKFSDTFKDNEVKVVHVASGLENAANQITSYLSGDDHTNTMLIWTASNNIVNKRSKREVLSEEKVKVYNSCITNDCMIFCFDEVNFYDPSLKNVKLNLATKNSYTSVCQDKSEVQKSWFEGNFTTENNKIQIRMDFEQKFYKTSARKWWKISNVTSIVDNNPLQVMTPRSYRKLCAPSNWSITCQSTEWMYNVETKDNKADFVRTEISFSNLQLQPFDTANGKMIYNHVDCNNWFTVPILLGLTVFFLLVILLLYGFYMVAGITTPDRFDDPRISKLLQIPQE